MCGHQLAGGVLQLVSGAAKVRAVSRLLVGQRFLGTLGNSLRIQDSYFCLLQPSVLPILHIIFILKVVCILMGEISGTEKNLTVTSSSKGCRGCFHFKKESLVSFVAER